MRKLSVNWKVASLPHFHPGSQPQPLLLILLFQVALVVADIPAIVNEAKKLNILTIVDSTFATLLRQRPLDFGADIVLQSVTKFLGGHSDLLLGAVICKANAHAEFMVKNRHDFGAIPGGLDAFLAMRGLRTLAVRLDRSETNALELAKRLRDHPKIKKVNFPALPGDSQDEKATRVLPNGCGGMLSFEIDTTPERVDQILQSLKVISHATSLGGGREPHRTPISLRSRK